MRHLIIVLGLALACGIAPTALASQVIVANTNVSDVTLGVNAKGQAMVGYLEHGKPVHLLAYGAENAIAPTPNGRQVAFTLAYDGGYKQYYVDNPTVKSTLAKLAADKAEQTANLAQLHHDQAAFARLSAGNPGRKALSAAINGRDWPGLNRQRAAIRADYATLKQLQSAATSYWKTFTCPAYRGPALADEVAACQAPDGSYWAVQSWPRDLPDYGIAPSAAQAAPELHLSHWTGALPDLDVHVDWSYDGRWNHLWGTYTYGGSGVYGFKATSSGEPLDSFGRNVYLDTYDSAYGPGWKRENSFLTHQPDGSWCYSVNPHGSHPAGTGSQYRLTILGPGVAPDVSVTVDAPGPYSKAAQAADNKALLALHDPHCVPH